VVHRQYFLKKELELVPSGFGESINYEMPKRFKLKVGFLGGQLSNKF
jgi:hypothetical protein